ncbi:MAG: D-alanyl-D-alanine carboxypeptidase/D-alanyl-D-alanine-endopeptidase [Prevotellaceae bacterium]|nr:D-alanyl-D-alanine carboxypeptidase/D-alanyl-D-alanine-endopeptidase [Prevotellaceae bacterium]
MLLSPLPQDETGRKQDFTLTETSFHPFLLQLVLKTAIALRAYFQSTVYLHRMFLSRLTVTLALLFLTLVPQCASGLTARTAEAETIISGFHRPTDILPATDGIVQSDDSLYNAIAMRVDSVLTRLYDPRATVSVDIADAVTGQRLYRSGAVRSLRPASCQKVLTTWSAIAMLGSHYLFHTRLYADSIPTDTLLRCNLYVRGEMDPLFSRADVKVFVDTLLARGIRTIEGDIVFDDSYKDEHRLGEGWCWDDNNPVLTPLLCDGRDILPQTLCEELSRAGISLRGALRIGYVPSHADLLCDRTHPLTAVLTPMMKNSINLYAESVFYALGRLGGRRSTALEAAAVIERQIKKLNLHPADYRIADGCGLSLYNYASAELLCTVLVSAWNDDEQRRVLFPTLPIAGVDGTLARRMRHSTARGKVHAKTGTLTGVSNLSGYATTADGRTLAFSLFCSGFLSDTEFHHLQDMLCEVMTAP